MRQIDALRSYLNSIMFERELVIDYSLAALLAGEHLFMLGPPGVAKTFLAEKLSEVLDVDKFIMLFSKETRKEDVFGPIKISSLKQDGYKRNIDGFLPSATIFVGDEVWKGGIVLNGLLTILNERKFDNGGERITCPLRTGFFASNELPEDSSLNALYDRMLFRVMVDYISDTDLFVSLMKSSMNIVEAPKINLGDLISEYELEVNGNSKYQFEDKLLERLHQFIIKCRNNGIPVSDRRAKAILKGLRALYYVRGHKIDYNIFYDIADMIWYSYDQRIKIHRLAVDAEDRFIPLATMKAINLEESLSRIMANFRAKKITPIEASAELKELSAKAEMEFQTDSNNKTEEFMNKLKQAHRSVLRGV